MARPPRLERGTLCLEGRCSIQLSYGRNSENGKRPDKAREKSSGLAINTIVESDPLRSIRYLLCPVQGPRQADLQQSQPRQDTRCASSSGGPSKPRTKQGRESWLGHQTE